MADKYHISPATGNPNRCYASTKPCPIGGEGEHYPTKEAAREAFEKTQENEGQTVTKLRKTTSTTSATSTAPGTVTSIGGKAITPEMMNDYKESHDKVFMAAQPSLSKAEIKTLADVAAGKKVSPEKLDMMIDRLRWADKEDPYTREGVAEAGTKVLTYLKAVRSQSPTPNTIPDARSFDPASQTVYSNKVARTDPMVMGKAIRRTAAHQEWMQELHDREIKELSDGSLTAEERAKQKVIIAKYSEEILRTEAHLQAQLKELQYCYDNDEAFRQNTKLGLVRHLKDGFYREPNSKYNNVPLTSVKKA